MSLKKASIEPLLNELRGWSGSLKALTIPSLEEASFSQERGLSLWRWGDVDPAARGLGTYLFDDLDGTGLFLTIVGSPAGLVKEIEIWRGDGRPAGRVPSVEDLAPAVHGKIV